jgi:photosystem II stability/assembly factor-like uncharacterized protein
VKTQTISLFFVLLTISALPQKSWQLISQPGTNTTFTDELTSYTYYNESVGSHGSKYSILKSSDGGHNYTLIKTKTGDFGCYSIDNIFALNSETYYYAESCQGICAIVKTPDGGETWVNLGYGGAFSMSLFYLREDFGYYSFYPGYPNASYLLQEGSAVFITPDYIFANGYPVPDQTTEIYFKNDSTGLIMCRDTIGNNVIIRSSDYGNSWSELLSFPGEAFNDMHFINDSVGFVIGSMGNIFRTADFGDSWENTILPGEMELNSIDFNTEGTGYLAADQGKMYKSTDNGLSWAEVESPGPDELVYVRVFDQDLVYTIDVQGKLYSNSGGADIGEIFPDQIRIYPNPATSELHISLPAECIAIENSIYGIQGRKLISSRKNTILLDGLRNGMYLLEIKTSKGVFIKKIFIK